MPTAFFEYEVFDGDDTLIEYRHITYPSRNKTVFEVVGFLPIGRAVRVWVDDEGELTVYKDRYLDCTERLSKMTPKDLFLLRLKSKPL